MRHINIWIITISALLFCGCDGLIEDLDESKLPKIESKLVVSCYISPQSAIISVIVSESQPLLGPASYNPVYITNAEVVLSGNAGQIRIRRRDSTSLYAVDSSAFKILAGQTYTLTVNDGKRYVKATCTVPANVPKIKNVLIEDVSGTQFNHYLGLRVRSSWEDIKGENNYYSTRGFIDYGAKQLWSDPITGDVGPVLQRGWVEISFFPPIDNLFNDANLDGSIFVGPELNMFFEKRDTIVYRDKNNVERSFDNEARISEVHIEVINMDEHYYQFLRSTANYKEDNKFTEPTPVYTNIQGGLGCFAAFNAVVFVDRSGW
ncbi:DUF4249 domain-containing protein [Dyadobacter arcticus]|uniref:DUF4249 domain-containing protein n=1 Tax=Dyadobacter arcticus TaxID=1078754 RepID=A0ABX0UIJ7_9BACT|nr:DUF4249 domain-containing protein [Dyadobacter arcticus]NIJ52627.1 hypothetical protein [Dyadobacter arcticus]